ncbi:MAG: lysophospholipid acyltransferase family protein [Chloroflexota bacterium]
MLDRTVYWLFRLSILLTRPLPLRRGYWFAERVALVCYWVIFPRQRKALNANLAHVLQSNDARFVDSVARRSFRNFGKYVIDFVHFPSITREEIKHRLRFDQWEAFNEAAQAGRGIIVATIHFGVWDFGAAALAAYGYPVNAIAETFPYPPMNDLVQGSRAKLGTNVIGHDRMGPTVFKALRRGEILALLVDVASSEATGIRVDFFGAPALVSPAAARIALRTNAWVMPAVVLRGPEDDVEIRPIIDTSLRDFTPTGDEARDVHELTRLIMQSMEKTIRQHPDQWFIFRRLWNNTATAPASAGTLAEGV